MKKNKVTVQDIANALDISRNTVSKALNGSTTVGEKTRELIVRKAIDMGYKKFSKEEGSIPNASSNAVSSEKYRMVTLLTHEKYLGISYWNSIIKGLEEALGSEGYGLLISFVNDIEEENAVLPISFSPDKVSGVVIIGVFTKEYYKKIQSVGIPTVFVDTAADIDDCGLLADTVMVSNEHSISRITNTLIEQGHERIGFIGDIQSCRSFYERWLGYKRAMMDAGLKIDHDLCFVEPNYYHTYTKDVLVEWIRGIKKMPSAVVCSNDSNAANLLSALKECYISVPDDVAVTGFDDIEEAKASVPNITTVRINKVELGKRAGLQIMYRIKNPNVSNELVRVSTEVIYRESSQSYIKKR